MTAAELMKLFCLQQTPTAEPGCLRPTSGASVNPLLATDQGHPGSTLPPRRRHRDGLLAASTGMPQQAGCQLRGSEPSRGQQPARAAWQTEHEPSEHAMQNRVHLHRLLLYSVPPNTLHTKLTNLFPNFCILRETLASTDFFPC